MRAATALRHADGACAIVAVVAAARTTGLAVATGFPLDDAWIHMVYGRALATSGTFDYDPGVPGSGATSPLWAIFAALAHLVAGADSPHGAAFVLKLFGVVAHACAAWLAARLTREMTSSLPAGLVAGVYVATSPQLALSSASGMEVSLTSAVLLGLFLASFRARTVEAGVLAGLALLARPESVVVAPLALWLACRRAGRARLAVSLACCAGPALAWSVRNRLAFGGWLPRTIGMKSFGLHGWDRARGLWVVFHEMLGASAPLMAHAVTLLAIVALAAGLRRPERRPGAVVAAAGLAWLVALAITTSFAAPAEFYFQRYALPVLPLVVVGAAGALERLCAMLPAHRARLLAALGVVAALVNIGGWRAAREQFDRDVASIDATQVAVGRFVAEHFPTDATVWSPDAGAVRYFGDRRILDIGGLNTASVLPRPGAIDSRWAADAVVLVIPYGDRAYLDDGTPPSVLFEAPESWRSRPPEPGAPGPMPQQIVAACPPGYRGQLRVAGGKIGVHGFCRVR